MNVVARGLVLSLWGMSIGLVVLGSSALADGAARVVLLGPSESDPTIVRLRRELKIVGIDVEVVLTAGEGPRDLAEVAREHHAPAAVALEPSPPAIVLWIDPARYSSAAADPWIRVDEGLAGSADHRLLVLRAVEILRERLLPVAVPAPAVADAAPADAPEAPTAATPPPGAADAGAPVPGDARSAPLPDHPRPSAFVGPAVLASPGGVMATPSVWLGARWAPLSRLDMELVALVPTMPATVSAPEGSMTLRAAMLGAGVSAKLTEPTSSVFLGAGAGLGAMLTAFAGQAHPPWQSASGLRAALLPNLHASAGYWVAPRVALRADVLAGFALPEPVLLIAGRRVAVFAEPATLFAAAIEVRL